MATFTKPSYYTIRGDSTLLNKYFRFLFSLLSISILIPTVAWADDGDMTTVVGTGPTGLFAGGFSGDGGPSRNAQLFWPEDIAVDENGNLFIADEQNHRIRRVDGKSGIITTIAGNGGEGYSGDGGPATLASLAQPNGVALDSDQNLIIADSLNNLVRKVDIRTNVIITIAGDGSTEVLAFPSGVATDSYGNVLIADYNNHRIRRIDAKTGILTTIAGIGKPDFLGDGGPAINAAFNNPFHLATDSSNNIFVADRDNHRIRKIDAKTGIITTVVGSGPSGSGKGSFSGDGGRATEATLDVPFGVAVDAADNLFVSDTSNRRVRKIDALTDIIMTVAGDGSNNFSDARGPARDSSFLRPIGLTADKKGHLYVADLYTQRIHMIEGIASKQIAPLVQLDLVILGSTYAIIGLVFIFVTLRRFLRNRRYLN